jgi:hypothetical protein
MYRDDFDRYIRDQQSNAEVTKNTKQEVNMRNYTLGQVYETLKNGSSVSIMKTLKANGENA